jgi:hypothetical protein
MCSREYRSNAEVCVVPGRSTLDCSEGFGNSGYSDCELLVRYDVQTVYAGGSSLSADVQCQADIEYGRGGGAFTGSDRARKFASHTLYAHGSDSGRLRLSFSFSSYDPVREVRVAKLRCEVTSVNLY